jgi:formate dehydrogenase iron-sulfur subunit
MNINRRKFLQKAALTGATAIIGAKSKASSEIGIDPARQMGVLVNLTKCIGCRKCEWACNQANDFTKKTTQEFESKSVFAQRRVHSSEAHTVVNQYQPNPEKPPVFVKTQCMHCNDPACYSACLVTAFKKEPTGAVTYDAGKCMGCRYCMVACPFEVPSYEFDDALTPRIRKCTLCAERLAEGKIPGCVEICPVQCLTFGNRQDLIKQAKGLIASHPDEYIDAIYGEQEVGGTSWIYISAYPFEKIGFSKLPSDAPSRLVEAVQHGIFKYAIGPVLLGAFLSGSMWNLKNHE